MEFSAGRVPGHRTRQPAVPPVPSGPEARMPDGGTIVWRCPAVGRCAPWGGTGCQSRIRSTRRPARNHPDSGRLNTARRDPPHTGNSLQTASCLRTACHRSPPKTPPRTLARTLPRTPTSPLRRGLRRSSSLGAHPRSGAASSPAPSRPAPTSQTGRRTSGAQARILPVLQGRTPPFPIPCTRPRRSPV
jgi:hypothetical protein